MCYKRHCQESEKITLQWAKILVNHPADEGLYFGYIKNFYNSTANRQPNLKMSEVLEQTFLKRWYTDDPKCIWKMLNIISHQEYENQNHNDIPLSHQLG